MEVIQFQNANQSYEDIIDNFIVRHREFERIIEDIRSANDGASFQHYIFVGKRGSGKSTLLRRIEAEIVKDIVLSSKYDVVNLGEEQSGIYRLYDLFDKVIRDLNSNGYEIDNIDFRPYKDDMKAYTKVLHGQINNALLNRKKKLILLIDNIDRVLSNRSKNDDASLLRELLMNFKEIRIIGGSTIMSEHFWKYDMPFYQFFSIKKLEALSMVEIQQLLNHWSEKKDLPEIKELINKYPGKIQSIRMLTDGMPRTMLLFVDMMINKPKQNGYEYLKSIIDKATPIYQERLGVLSAAQKKVLSELALLWDAASVEELVPKCKMDGKTISALLNQLTESNNVEKIKSNTKNHLYRVEERFFNLWFIMTQGGPQQKFEAKALTDFLENWYEKSELNDFCFELSKSVIKGEVKLDYFEAMSHALLNSDSIASEPKEELYRSMKKTEIFDINKSFENGKLCSDFNAKIDKALEEQDYEKALELLIISDISEGKKYYGIGLAYQNLKKYDLAEKNYLTSSNLEDNCSSLYNLAFLYEEQGKYIEAEDYYIRAIKNGDKAAITNLGNLYKKQGKSNKAEECYLYAIEMGDFFALNNLALLYYGRNKKNNLVNLFQQQTEENIEKWIRSNNEFASIIYLYLGHMEIFKKLLANLMKEDNIVSHNFLFHLLCHKQINWVINYFNKKHEAVELYKPLYFATLSLSDKQNDLLKMPPEINENVKDIILKVNKIQTIYYH